MVLWRISFFRDLRGIGGLRAPGRWHHAGQPIVYLGDSPSTALLECCVHTAAEDIPPTITLLRVEGPEVDVPGVAEGELPENWLADRDWTRARGTTWLREGSSLLLRVPSAIIPFTSNFLFNPAHPDARLFRIAETFTYPFDPRLKR